jgi:hypothetical protein
MAKISMRDLRAAAYARAHGRCEITGLPLPGGPSGPWECHHRRPKGMGGTRRTDEDSLPNLLAITAAIHNGGPHSVHQDPAWSRPRGYLVSKLCDHPGLVPVLLHGRQWVILGADGDYLDVTGT